MTDPTVAIEPEPPTPEPGWADAVVAGYARDEESARSNGHRSQRGHRSPPADAITEAALLGAALLNPEALRELATRLTARDFYTPRHAALAGCLIDSWHEGTLVDLGAAQTLYADRLRIVGVAEPSVFLTELVGGTPSTTSAPHYVDRLASLATARQLLTTGQELVGAIYRGHTDEAAALVEQLHITSRQRATGPTEANLSFESIPDPFETPKLGWLVRGLVCHPTHGELAGAEKSLKTYIGMATDVALAAGVDVLGRWSVPKPVAVLNIIGEGGEAGYLRRLDRIASAYGTTVDELRPMLRYTTQTMPVSSPRFIDGLRQALDEHQPGLVRVDPWYTYAPTAADSRSLYETGAALEQVGRIVREGGATLILSNHFNQTGAGDGLRRITMAGHAEWCDSWWLVKHRDTPDVTNGRFKLRLDVGSRQWGGGAFDVDFTIGRYDADRNEHIGDISWTVADSRDCGTVDVDDVKIAKAIERLVKVWTRRRDGTQAPWTKTGWVERATGTSSDNRAAFERLVDGGRIVVVDGDRSSRGATYRLEMSSIEQP